MSDSKETELEPCPWPMCGGSATLDLGGLDADEGYAFVTCLRCHSMGPPKKTEAEAITAWNSRPSVNDPQISARIEAWERSAEAMNDLADEIPGLLTERIQLLEVLKPFADAVQDDGHRIVCPDKEAFIDARALLTRLQEDKT